MNFAKVLCTIQPGDVIDRYQASSIPMATYRVALSNDGVNFSSAAPVVVYDSKCMECTKANINGSRVITDCKLKVKTIRGTGQNFLGT